MIIILSIILLFLGFLIANASETETKTLTIKLTDTIEIKFPKEESKISDKQPATLPEIKDIRVEILEDWHRRRFCPTLGTEKKYLEEADKNEIMDWRVIVAISWKEQRCDKDKNYNNLTGMTKKGGGYVRYDSYAESIEDSSRRFGQLLERYKDYRKALSVWNKGNPTDGLGYADEVWGYMEEISPPVGI